MDAQRWQRLSPLLDALLELEPAQRAQRLAELAEEDSDAAAELEALVALEERHGDFLSQPLVAPPQGPRAGTELGPYRLEYLLGEGGMGEVWLAVRADGLYQRRMALKLLRPGLVGTQLRLRFTRERQILARLAHPHIARLLDAGISNEGWPYLALEFVDGQPITDYCRDQDVPLETRLHMFRQICDAVSHAHANLIVHRDLKPSNILVTPAGEVRLLDFGIAKLLDGDGAADGASVEQTRTGTRTFTLHYAAPEQIRGEPVTTMTDVYALGVVLYELLTGSRPYRLTNASDAQWEEAIVEGDPLRPSQTALRVDETRGPDERDRAARRRLSRQLAGDLDNIVLKALSKRPERRYPSVEALAQDLNRFDAGRPVRARRQSIHYRLERYVRRHRWALASASMMAVVLTAALLIVAWQARQTLREAGRAQAMQDFMVGVFENAAAAHGSEPLDLRQLLEASVERGSRELAQQPRALAELYGLVARLHIGLGDYPRAQSLLDRQARIIAGHDAMPTSVRLESLTQRGRVSRLLGQPLACIELMQPALGQAGRDQARLLPQATEFYSQLGRCHRANDEPKTARLLFLRSLELRRDRGVDPVGEAENMIDLAGLHADAGTIETALAQFKSARTLLHRAAGKRHPLLIDIQRNLGRLDRASGDITAAERELREALAISLNVNGTRHPTTDAVRRQLASVLVDQGRFAQAQAELRELHRGLVARLPDDAPQLATSYADIGHVAWMRGDTAAALASLRRALAIRRGADDPLALAGTLSGLAAVLQATGAASHARVLLLEARQLYTRHAADDLGRRGDIERQLGVADLELGHTRDADQALRRAVRLTRSGYGSAHPHTRRAELALAWRDARAGQAGATARLTMLAALPEGDLDRRKTAWRARAYLARLRCAGSQRDQALQSLQSLELQLQKVRPEGGVVPRQVAAIRADCAQAHGGDRIASD